MGISSREGSRALVLCYFLILIAVLYLCLFFFPRTPIYWEGDQSFYLLNARRMLEGKVIYRDFFQFTPAGMESLNWTFFKVFGPRAWVPNVQLLLVGLGIAWLSLVISQGVLNGPSAFLPGLLFITSAFVPALDNTHHWYSALMALAGVAVLMKERTPGRLAWAGGLCGLAAWFTQARGLAALLGLAVYFGWECHHRKQRWRAFFRGQISLFSAFLAVVLATNAFFAWKAGLRRFLYCTVAFGSRYYSADKRWNSIETYMTGMPRFLPWYRLPVLGVWLFIHGLLPLIYLLFFVWHWRESKGRPAEPWDRLMLLNIAGLFLFLGIAGAPGFNRLGAGSLPAIILLVWRATAAIRMRRILVGFLWAFAVLLVAAEPINRQNHWHAYVDVPAGRVGVRTPALYEKYQWLVPQVHPSEFFLQAGHADVYFAFGLRSPAGVPYLTPTDYTRPEQVEEVIRGLEEHKVKFVLWRFDLDLPAGSPSGDHLGPLRAYLRNSYHPVKAFSDFDVVWERGK